MTQKEKIQQEIERTLQSLDHVKRAEANPFLYTRIRARIQKQQSSLWERTFSFMSRPMVALAIVFLVMVINGWSFMNTSTSNPIISVSDPNPELSGLPEFESEYKSITTTESYDYENINNQ